MLDLFAMKERLNSEFPHSVPAGMARCVTAQRLDNLEYKELYLLLDD